MPDLTPRTSSLFCIAVLLGIVLLSPPGFAQSQQPVTGETVTYTISLQPGNNLVGLPLVPGAASAEEIVSGVLPVLTLMQDAGGSYFVPSQGISGIDTWDWVESYRVHLASSGSFSVEGPSIVPEASPLVLEEGANWIPYLRNSALPVQDALASIAASLVRVEDANGRVYVPGDPGSTLSWLFVGHGYKVWVSQRDTLYYPANTHSGNGASEASTMAAALALTGLEVGQEIDVLGYYAPGDGGGGRFRVEASGAVPDGGTVFVPNEHTSAPVVEALPNYQTARYLNLLPDGQRVVYGSLTVDLLQPGSGASIFTVEGKHLHGVEWMSRYQNNMTFNYATGELRDLRQRLKNHCHFLTGGDGWACNLRFTYRHTTSPLRLHRLGVGATLNADWFGARTRDVEPGFDNQPVLNHMINVADRMNAETPGTVTTIHLPKLAVYEYFGSIRLSDGLTLRGAGGTELVTVTNDLGHTYSPVRLKASRTTLRVKSNEALTHIRMQKHSSDPFYLDPDVKEVLHTRKTVIYIQPGAMSARLEHIVLDGNWEGNQQAWTEGWASHEEKESSMRNTPGWSGFISTNHGGVDIPPGQTITIRNAAILGYGATGVLGNVNNEWVGENVRLGNSLWNHPLYQTSGTWENLSFEGFAWGSAFYAGEITNLVFENGAAAPYRPNGRFLGIRGGDAYTETDLEGNTQYQRTDGTFLPLGVTINGFYVDLRGTDHGTPFAGIGPRMVFRNGVVITRDDSANGLFVEGGNGYQKALYPDYHFENITIYDTDAARMEYLLGTLNVTNSVFRNITTVPLNDHTQQGNRVLSLRAHRRDHYAWDTPQVVVFDNIHHASRTNAIASASINSSAAGIEYFITNSSFNNRNYDIFYGPSGGTGTWGDSPPDFDLLKVYMRNVDFRMTPGHYHNKEVFLTLGYFEDVRDTIDGYVSESNGTVDMTAAGGETFVDVAPNLWWVPMTEEYVTYTGADAGLIASVLPRCSNGENAFGATQAQHDDRRGCALRFTLTRALTAGEALTFDWTAAVRPWPAGVTVPEYAQ